MTLLLWTAADLTNASICALDSDEFGGSPSGESTDAMNALPTNPRPAQPTPHIDDCFCCSHCVEVAVLVPAIVGESIARREPPLDAAAPDSFGFPLYHPPLV